MQVFLFLARVNMTLLWAKTDVLLLFFCASLFCYIQMKQRYNLVSKFLWSKQRDFVCLFTVWVNSGPALDIHVYIFGFFPTNFSWNQLYLFQKKLLGQNLRIWIIHSLINAPAPALGKFEVFRKSFKLNKWLKLNKLLMLPLKIS